MWPSTQPQNRRGWPQNRRSWRQDGSNVAFGCSRGNGPWNRLLMDRSTTAVHNHPPHGNVAPWCTTTLFHLSGPQANLLSCPLSRSCSNGNVQYSQPWNTIWKTCWGIISRSMPNKGWQCSYHSNFADWSFQGLYETCLLWLPILRSAKENLASILTGNRKQRLSCYLNGMKLESLKKHARITEAPEMMTPAVAHTTSGNRAGRHPLGCHEPA